MRKMYAGEELLSYTGDFVVCGYPDVREDGASLAVRLYCPPCKWKAKTSAFGDGGGKIFYV